MSNNYTCGPTTEGESHISLYSHTHGMPTGSLSGLNPSHDRDEVLFSNGTNAFGRWSSSDNGTYSYHCLNGHGTGVNADWSLNSEVIFRTSTTCGDMGTTEFNVTKKSGEEFARFTMNTMNTCHDQVTYCAGCIDFTLSSYTYVPWGSNDEIVFFAYEDCIMFRGNCFHTLHTCTRNIIIK